MNFEDMKKIGYLLLVMMAGVLVFSSCRDEETYAEQKERERNVILSFVNRDKIVLLNHDGDTLLSTAKMKVISEEEFCAHDSMTNVDDNEYVLFANTGVYMQIVRKGVGKKIQSGETKRLVCRYFEFNLMTDSLQTSDNVVYWSTNPEIMNVSNTDGVFAATFDTSINGGGAMFQSYRSTVVPSAWLLPLRYINVGRQLSSTDGIAKVRLVVPHSENHDDAKQNVYPCFYEISYQEMRE